VLLINKQAVAMPTYQTKAHQNHNYIL